MMCNMRSDNYGSFVNACRICPFVGLIARDVLHDARRVVNFDPRFVVDQTPLRTTGTSAQVGGQIFPAGR